MLTAFDSFHEFADPEFQKRLTECAIRNAEIQKQWQKKRNRENLIKRQIAKQEELCRAIYCYRWNVRQLNKGAKNEREKTSGISTSENQQPHQPD